MAENIKATTVTSVFKSGENTTTEQAFTAKWIELVNTLEKGKSANFCKKA